MVVSGTCHINEALITGEADEIKNPRGQALSGSFVISGSCAPAHQGGPALRRKTNPGGQEVKKRISRDDAFPFPAGQMDWHYFSPFGVALCIKEIHGWAGAWRKASYPSAPLWA